MGVILAVIMFIVRLNDGAVVGLDDRAFVGIIVTSNIGSIVIIYGFFTALMWLLL